jgi:hypothetical protein
MYLLGRWKLILQEQTGILDWLASESQEERQSQPRTGGAATEARDEKIEAHRTIIAFSRRRLGLRLTVNILAMSDFQHPDRYSLILKMTDEAIVPHPVAPQTLLFTAERLAPPARIFRCCQPFAQKSLN